jgi:hypothetical protein
MKIIISQSFKYSDEWRHAFQELNHNVAIWTADKPAFDIFDEEEPDLLICDEKDVTVNLSKCLAEYDYVKTAFHVNNVNHIENFYNIINKCTPDILFSDKITDTSFATLAIPPAFDDSIVNKEDKPGFGSDIVVVGNYDITHQKYVLPFCDGKHNIRIFGCSELPLSQYVGTTTKTDRYHIYKNSKISLVFDEEQLYTAVGCGGFAVANFENELSPYAEHPKDLVELVRSFLEGDNLQCARTSAGNYISKVLNEHTYKNRVTQLLRALAQ